MSNYNKGEYIATAIDSVLKQNYADWELVIYDDGSTDCSKAVIGRYSEDKRINYLSSPHRRGTIACLEEMISIARGSIIAILDSDDALAPTAIAEIIQAYNDNPECGLIYTQCWYCDRDLRPVHLGFSAFIPVGLSNLQVNNVVALRTFRRSVFFQTVGLDKGVMGAEDLDMILKIEEKTKLFFLDRPLYFYRVLSQSQTHKFKAVRINRSSSAQAKLNAYERRINTNIPNLDKYEISEVIFFGIINSLLAGRWSLLLFFLRKQIAINPLAILEPQFYRQILKKINKIMQLKKNKALLKV